MRPLPCAIRTTAAAIGCSLACSRLAAYLSNSDSATSSTGMTATTSGRPAVSVPVLSSTSVSTSSSSSSDSALRNSTPACAPRPIATVIDMGVARPSAHGQATMSVLTAISSACARRGSGPSNAHATAAINATSTTAGTNQAETRSARACTGARLRCASATVCTMRASTVSAPTRSARITSAAVPFTVPPMTAAPGDFATGSDSPVTIDSSTGPRPSTIAPSTGILSPGRIRNWSPTRTSASGTSVPCPSGSMRWAVFGARSSSARSASPVRARARSSSTWPNSTSVTIIAADSK